jgi:hypothetical protein
MIKFFRHIRQRLVTESKFSKYMIYAIGEIVLVVIGILIALSINTWNQGRQASHKEASYIENLHTDLEEQLEYVEIQLEYEVKYFEVSNRLLGRFKQESMLTIDTASSKDLSILTERKTFTKADPTYQDLISTGNIGLIQDESLRNELLSYYLELERIDKIMLNNNALLIDEMFGLKIVHSAYIGEPDQRLYDVSNQLLQEPARELMLINIIDFREKIAGGNIERMNLLKEMTEGMLQSLKQHRP